MGSYQDLDNILKHIGAYTRNPDAWKTGLSDQQQRDVLGWQKSQGEKRGYTDDKGNFYEHRYANNSDYPEVPDSVLDGLRKNHPTLFDPNTKAPVVPPVPPTPPAGQGAPPAEKIVPTDEQNKGRAAEAAKRLEDKLQDSNDKAVDANRKLAQILLNAHSTTLEGAKRLNDIHKDVEAAAKSPALDTKIGKAEFQRFLNGKLAEIGEVIKSANLDVQSQKEMASALADFYATRDGKTGSGTGEGGGQGGGEGGAGGSGGGGGDLGGGDMGGDYGFGDLGPEAGIDDGGLGGALGGATQALPQAMSAIPQALGGLGSIPGALGSSLGGLGGGLGGLGSGGGGLGDLLSGKGGKGREHDGPEFRDGDDPLLGGRRDRGGPDGPTINNDDNTGLLGGPDNTNPADPKPGDPQANPNAPGAPAPATTGPTAITIKDGQTTFTVTADNPQTAAAVEEIAKGANPEETFRKHGMTLLPATAPPNPPLNPDQLKVGSYARYSNGEIVVALGGQKAIMGGHVVPISATAKDGFLFWANPPATPATAAATPAVAPTTPAPGQPAPTITPPKV